MGTVRTELQTELLRDEIGFERRLARLEALVDVHLEKGGTLERLQNKAEGTNTRVLMISGGVTALLNALRFLTTVFFNK